MPPDGAGRREDRSRWPLVAHPSAAGAAWAVSACARMPEAHVISMLKGKFFTQCGHGIGSLGGTVSLCPHPSVAGGMGVPFSTGSRRARRRARARCMLTTELRTIR